MSGTADLIVIGGGPAGVEGALAACDAGLDVTLIDESPAAGGQVYRALPASFSPVDGDALGPDHVAGERLRAALAASGVRHVANYRVWLAAPGFRVDALGPDGVRSWTAPALLVATGATERIVPFSGWTTPGVFGLAAATIMLKSQRILPGRMTIVAGCGPLLAAVSAGIIKAGGDVVALVDLARPTNWLKALPAITNRPDLLVRGLGWLARVGVSGARARPGCAIVGVDGKTCVEAVAFQPVDRDGRIRHDASVERIACDSLVVGHGLTPNTDLTRVLGAHHVFAAERGGWFATRDADMRTSVAKLYVAGDGGGISGAAAAHLQGRLAGLTAARDLGRIDANMWTEKRRAIVTRLAKAERFGRAMARLMALQPGLVHSIPNECVVCRCEDVTRAEIEIAITLGAAEVNQVKAWTRCGMGPCQGKICGEAVATLVAGTVGGRERAGAFTARPPFRPVPTEALAGEFAYADIPIPPPAPL